ncbi:MAG: hypothetical protein ACRBCK_03175 [Alphaproteobacteria bacterium]
MSSGEEDLGAMAWPGFVDILSSVIIMFVFFVMVVASALYFHIIIFKSKILSEFSEYTSASSSAQELATTNRSLMEKIKELEDKVKVLEEPSDENDIQLYQQHTQFAESKNQSFIQDTQERSFVVFFGKDSISITKENYIKLNALIEKYADELGAQETIVDIVAGNDPNAANDAVSKKLALARMLNVRNLFLDGNIPLEQLEPSISGDEEIESTYNWVKVTFGRK